MVIWAWNSKSFLTARSPAANEGENDLPRGLLDGLELFEGAEKLHGILGSEFMAVYGAIKREEYETFMKVISPWEREYLLLNV